MIELKFKYWYMWFDSDNFDFRVTERQLFIYYYDKLFSILPKEYCCLKYLCDNEIIYEGDKVDGK